MSRRKSIKEKRAASSFLFQFVFPVRLIQLHSLALNITHFEWRLAAASNPKDQNLGVRKLKHNAASDSSQSRQLVPVAKLVVEFVKGDSSISTGHVGESLFNRSEVVSRCLDVGMLEPPFVEDLFRRTLSTPVVQLGTKELVKSSQFLNRLTRHG